MSILLFVNVYKHNVYCNIHFLNCGKEHYIFNEIFFKKCPGYISTLFYSLFQIKVSITLKNTYKYTSRNYTETKIHFVRKFIIGKSEVLSIRKFWGPIVQSMNIIIRVFFHVVFN